jgi:hypothetical protein
MVAVAVVLLAEVIPQEELVAVVMVVIVDLQVLEAITLEVEVAEIGVIMETTEPMVDQALLSLDS